MYSIQWVCIYIGFYREHVWVISEMLKYVCIYYHREKVCIDYLMDSVRNDYLREELFTFEKCLHWLPLSKCLQSDLREGVCIDHFEKVCKWITFKRVFSVFLEYVFSLVSTEKVSELPPRWWKTGKLSAYIIIEKKSVLITP